MKTFLIAVLVYLLVGLLLDAAYALRTDGLPWYHWMRAVRVALTFTALGMFSAFVWPFVNGK